ncbi:MAG: OmpA family protein [Pseudomonadota bacterium]
MPRLFAYYAGVLSASAFLLVSASLTMAQSTFHQIEEGAAPEEVLEAFRVGTSPSASHAPAQGGIVSAPDDGGWNWVPTTVNFELNSARLAASEQGLLDVVGQALARDESLVLVVSGHTDSLGSDAVNDRLSLTRAQSVAAFLSEIFDIEQKRLLLRWRGAREPLPGLSPDDPLNRRVQFGNRKSSAPELREELESDTRAVSDLLRLLRDGKNPNE